MKKDMACLLALSATLAFAETVDELAPYAKGASDDYWDTTGYQPNVVTRATSAAFNPLLTDDAEGTNGSFFDFGIFCMGLSNLLDICADPSGIVITIY